MIIRGVSGFDVQSCTVEVTNGAAAATLILAGSDPLRPLGKLVQMQLPDGVQFTGVITAVNNIGSGTGQYTYTAKSVVNVVLDMAYKGTSTEHEEKWDSGLYSTTKDCYTGVMFAGLNASTGELERKDVLLYAQSIARAMGRACVQRFGVGLNVQSTASRTGKTIDKLRWDGASAQQLIHYLLGDVYNVCMRIDGTTLTFVVYDYNSVTRYLLEKDCNSADISIDLEQCTTNVVIESPNIVSQKKQNLPLPSAKKYVGLSHLYTSLAGGGELVKTGSGELPDNYEFDEELSILRYTTASNKTADLYFAQDRRMRVDTGHYGDAYNVLGWENTQVVIDNDLGKAEDGSGVSWLVSKWDRTNNMSEIANEYVRTLSNVPVAGTVSVDAAMKIQVGDVVKLWCCPFPAVVMGVAYMAHTKTKVVTLGTTTGSYDDYKGRARLSEIKQRKEQAVSDERTVLVDMGYGWIRKVPVSMVTAWRKAAIDAGMKPNFRVLWNAKTGGWHKTADKSARKARQAARRAHSEKKRAEAAAAKSTTGSTQAASPAQTSKPQPQPHQTSPPKEKK